MQKHVGVFICVTCVVLLSEFVGKYIDYRNMHDMSNLKAHHRSFLPIAFARLRKTFEQKVLEVEASLRNSTSRAHAGTS